MIHMHTHPERVMFRERRAQLRRDALRHKNRNPRADPEKFNVSNRAQSRKQFVDLVAAKNESVAAAQKHVTHLRVLFEITERLLEIRVQFLFADAAHHAAARAVAAIARATIRYQEQDAVG